MAKGSQRTTSFAFFCVVIALAVYFMLNPFGKTIPFKPEVWKNEARYQKMAMYLVEKNLLKGKNLPQTLDMLGQPDETRPGQAKETLLKYWLTGSDSMVLLVELDSAQVFRNARIIEH